MYLARLVDNIVKDIDGLRPDLHLRNYGEWKPIRNGFIVYTESDAWVLTATGYRPCAQGGLGLLVLTDTLVLDWRDPQASYYVKLRSEDTRSIYCERKADQVTEWPLVDGITSKHGCRSSTQTVYPQHVWGTTHCRAADVDGPLHALCNSGGVDYAIIDRGDYYELVATEPLFRFGAEYDSFDVFEIADGVVVINANGDHTVAYVYAGEAVMYADNDGARICMVPLC